MLKDILTPMKRSFREYTELRAQENTSASVAFVKGNLVSNSRSTTGGVSARVYKGGVFGFASAPEYDEDSLRACIASAERNAVFLDGKVKKGLAPLPRVAEGELRPPIRSHEVPQKILVDTAAEIDAYVAKKYPDLLSRTVYASELNIEKLSTVSGSSGVHSFVPRSQLYVIMTAEAKDGSPCEILLADANNGLFDEIYADPSRLFPRIDLYYDRLRDKCEGVYADAGVRDVVFSPLLTGMLSHEAVGHTVEADLVLGGSVAGHNLGKTVAAEKVSMVDFAHHYGGEELPIPVYADDEGTPAGDVLLIDHGVLKGFMHDKKSAMHFGAEPTGNARAFAFSDEPLIRMRNTAVLPGKDKLPDMIASIEDGYYLIETNNGQADTTGEFMFGVTMGYEIKNGALGRAIRDTTISGVAFDMLKTVTMVGDDLEWCCSGMCGKKQPIPVSMGGVSLKCRVNVGGR